MNQPHVKGLLVLAEAEAILETYRAVVEQNHLQPGKELGNVLPLVSYPLQGHCVSLRVTDIGKAYGISTRSFSYPVAPTRHHHFLLFEFNPRNNPDEL